MSDQEKVKGLEMFSSYVRSDSFILFSPWLTTCTDAFFAYTARDVYAKILTSQNDAITHARPREQFWVWNEIPVQLLFCAKNNHLWRHEIRIYFISFDLVLDICPRWCVILFTSVYFKQIGTTQTLLTYYTINTIIDCLNECLKNNVYLNDSKSSVFLLFIHQNEMSLQVMQGLTCVNAYDITVGVPCRDIEILTV